MLALPPSRARAESLFEAFRQNGHIARQDEVGIAVIPGGLGVTWYAALAEGSRTASGFVPVVMLSNPTLSDEGSDSWVDVLRGWSAALPSAALTAYSREIKIQKDVESGLP